MFPTLITTILVAFLLPVARATTHEEDVNWAIAILSDIPATLATPFCDEFVASYAAPTAGVVYGGGGGGGREGGGGGKTTVTVTTTVAPTSYIETHPLTLTPPLHKHNPSSCNSPQHNDHNRNYNFYNLRQQGHCARIGWLQTTT
ncbi:hypothetical protein GMOD_00003650 [Pyrenophora seminiperda CCB06]|uniref:Uncharacterized protein n=1 Tax=Pyrenophora seminiperda CCB06 TaxID=1302712 RepID=A0A3M7MJ97_9PLEO|nr:hypothetical protein GMOD_00003650 [Pyrenophora seminiperda CCB06]